MLDPFGARGIGSTVANQTQYSFAASAYDVLAAWKVLSARSDIDAGRIGAQGHSRGGSAVLTAATRRFADAASARGAGCGPCSPAYPWSGHQFLDPRRRRDRGARADGRPRRVVLAHAGAGPRAGHAPRGRQGDACGSSPAPRTASIGNTPLQRIAEASVSPGAPTIYLADDGAFFHPLESTPRPELVDRDLMVYGLKAGYGSKGARIGGSGDHAALFRADMLDVLAAHAAELVGRRPLSPLGERM